MLGAMEGDGVVMTMRGRRFVRDLLFVFGWPPGHFLF